MCGKCQQKNFVNMSQTFGAQCFERNVRRRKYDRHYPNIFNSTLETVNRSCYSRSSWPLLRPYTSAGRLDYISQAFTVFVSAPEASVGGNHVTHLASSSLTTKKHVLDCVVIWTLLFANIDNTSTNRGRHLCHNTNVKWADLSGSPQARHCLSRVRMNLRCRSIDRSCCFTKRPKCRRAQTALSD